MMKAIFSVLHLAIAAVQLGIAIACSEEGAVQLVNGENKFEGLVEVCDSGEWKSVCSNMWGSEEAGVVCRQIGFTGDLAPVAVNDGRFGASRGGIVEAKWECVGSESQLLDCPKDGASCNADEVAGVQCFGMPGNCTEGEIRLSHSNRGVGSGRVELCLDGLWGTVCDDGWDINEATTVCSELGYIDTSNTYGIPTRRAYFGEGNGPIHLSRVGCTSNDRRLVNCTSDMTGTNSCSHREDAGVICLGNGSCGDGEVRLVNGTNEREGRVEICYNGVWGTVCDYGWDQVDASVVCTQLGHGHGGLATKSSRFGSGEGPVLFNDVSCNQSHTQLSQCLHLLSIGIHECTMDSIAGVVCPEVTNTPPITPGTVDSIDTTESGATTTFKETTPQSSGVTESADSSTIIIRQNHVPTTLSPELEMETTVESENTPSLIFPALQSAILGAVGGALVVGVIATVVIVLMAMMLMRSRRRKKDSPDKEAEIAGDSIKSTLRSVDNPAFGEGVILSGFNHEKYDQLHLYSEIGSPETTTPQYEALYAETTTTTDTRLDNSIHSNIESEENSVRSNLTDEEGQNKVRLIKEITFGADYEVPYDVPALDNMDTTCYSKLGPTSYSTLEPHIHKATHHHPPPPPASDNDYSQLQH